MENNNINNYSDTQLYKGYIVTNNKKPMMTFKDGSKLMTLEFVTECNYKEYSGVLGDDTVLIDIDDVEQSKVLLSIIKDYNCNCRVYETNRGLHFLFKNSQFVDGGSRPFNQNYTKQLLACGLVADIKVGCKNSIEVLKFNNELRKIVYDKTKSNKNGCYDEVPFFLWTFKHDKLSKDTIIYPIEDGSRNDLLYEYKLALYRYFKQSFSKDQYKTILTILNKYICVHSLDDNEFKLLSRYENNTKTKNPMITNTESKKPSQHGNTKLNELEIALYIINTQCVHFINYKKVLYVYENYRYTSDNDSIQKALNYVSECIGEYIGIAKREYVLLQLRANLPCIYDITDNYINFKNGLYDVNNRKFLGYHTHQVITFNQIPHNYKPCLNVDNCDCGQRVEKFFDDLCCNNKDIKTLLYETIGYSMVTDTIYRKMFILHGGKANGKSTFLSLLRNVIGDENTTKLCFSDVDKKFSLVAIENKLLSIGDDIENRPIENTGTLKKLVSGEEIRVEQKCQPSYVIKPYATLFYSCNQIPHIKNDETGAMLDRIIYIPFQNYFKPSGEFKKWFTKNLLNNEQVMEYIVSNAVNYLLGVYDRDEFTQCAKVKHLHSVQSVTNNTISTFITDRGYERKDFIDMPIRTLYNEYIKYLDCLFEDEDDKQSIKKDTIRTFSKYIRNNYNLSSKSRKIKQDNGLLKCTKVFTEIQD